MSAEVIRGFYEYECYFHLKTGGWTVKKEIKLVFGFACKFWIKHTVVNERTIWLTEHLCVLSDLQYPEKDQF